MASLTRALARQVPPAVRAKGAAYYERGAVVHADAESTRVDAIVRGSRPYRVWVARDGDALSASCECKYFQDRASICKHIWAVILEVERNGYLGLPGDVASTLQLRPDAPASVPAGEWQTFIAEVSEKIARAERDARPPRFRDADIIYAIDRGASLAGQSVALDLMSRERRRNGKWGKPEAGRSSRPATCRSCRIPLDREIVPLLLGASDIYGSGYVGDSGRASFRLAGPLVDRVLPLIAQSGRAVLRIRRSRATN